jgi:hypothetical protein
LGGPWERSREACLFGGSGGAAAGGYGKTNEGKIIAAAFLDNYNNVVPVVRSDTALQRNVGTLLRRQRPEERPPRGLSS